MPVGGFFIGLANLANGIYNGQKSREAAAELMEKMERLESAVQVIQSSLRRVLGEVKWTQVMEVIASSLTDIEYDYDIMKQLDVADKKPTEAWAEGVVKSNLPKALFVIHQAMMGQNMLLDGAVMQIFVQKLSEVKNLPQSHKWIGADYFMDMLLVQGKGYSVLITAHEILQTGKSKALKGEMNSRFQKQEDVARSNVDELSYEFQNPAWDESYFKWSSRPFVDTNENVADLGKVVVGLQLYEKGNRIGLRIAQATPKFSTLEETLSMIEWKDSPGWGEDKYFNLKSKGYVDTNVNIVPKDMVITGAAIYCKGNRMAIKLQMSKINLEDGAVSQPSWQESPGWGENYFKAGNAKYCDTHQVIPSILSCLSGAALYQKGNRIGIKVLTLDCRYSYSTL